jgi:hypothetical protein
MVAGRLRCAFNSAFGVCRNADAAALCESLCDPHLLPGHGKVLGLAEVGLWNQSRNLIAFFKGTILYDGKVGYCTHADILGDA